jgi:4-diphosphocytidyl-2-C-methyl-D-erythritol kinase
LQRSWNAYAKVNLTLDVLGRRPDGYHDLQSVMQPLALCDRVEVLPADSLTLESDDAALPTGEANLAVRAARLLAASADCARRVRIRIAKRIPQAAGLAGGSADAAAVLRAVDELCGLHLTEERLHEAALQLGSDVPFCLLNRTAMAEGRGERLTPLPPAPALPVVVATPRVVWSGPKTATVFSLFRTGAAFRRPDQAAMLRALRASDAAAIAEAMVNVLEPVTASLHPIIADLKQAMLEAGALGAVMTGAGPSVLAIAPSVAGRRAIAEAAGRLTDLVVETEFLA